MRRILSVLSVLFLLFNCHFSVLNAVPVYRMPVVKVQPNGDTLRLFLTGDEYYHRLHDSAGYTIVQHPQTGYWVYATTRATGVDRWDVVASDFIVGESNPQTASIVPNIVADKATLEKRHNRLGINVSSVKTSDRNHGTLNNIVIFIRFSDDQEITTPFSTIHDMFNDSTANAVSLYNYFKSVSYNDIYIPSYFAPSPSGNSIVSYQDSLPRAYYEPYNAVTNPQGYHDDSEAFTREQEMLERAVNYVNDNCPLPANIDFDLDNDGKIDNVCFIVKGNCGDWDDLLWPHKAFFYGIDIYINGKQVYDYNFQLEGSGYEYFNVSTFCHEMFHSLGAPDIYHYYTDVDISPVGYWDLMGFNNNPPQNMSAYLKYKYGTWLDSIPEIRTPGTYSLHSLASSNRDNCCYKIASIHPDQWYVLEYRNNNDLFDQSLPGSGLLIYRVDRRFTGNVSYNGSSVFDEVYLYRPGGLNQYTNGNLAQAPFSASVQRTAFDYTTNPYPWLMEVGIDSTIIISDISEPGETITFSVDFGTACVKPRGTETNNIGMNGATLSWQAHNDSFQVQWRKKGTENADYAIVEENSYRLEGLEPNTGYEWRVRGLCDGGGTSEYSEWIMFFTETCENSFNLEFSAGDVASPNLPISLLFFTSITQTLFTEEEMSGPKNIDRVSFNYNSTTPIDNKGNCTIYMGHTDLEEFSGITVADFIPIASLSKVYQGDLNCVEGWNTFKFDTVFSYDGNSNLVLCILDNSLTPGSANRQFSCATTQRPLSISGNAILELNPENPSFIVVQTYLMRSDVRFGGCLTMDGIDEATGSNVFNGRIAVNGRTITVSDEMQRPVSLYDITGRHIMTVDRSRQHSAGVSQDSVQLTAPAPGVYLIAIPGMQARKVVIL